MFELQAKELSCKAIGTAMLLHKSTISRELRRNKTPDQLIAYLPDKAHRMAQRKRSVRKKKIVKNYDLRSFIVSHLCKKWSPMIISGHMRQQALPFYASPETIYQFVYSDPQRELYWFLPQHSKKRGMLYARRHRSSTIHERESIHNRPAAVLERLEEGHFEGDLIFHTGNQSANIAVLVERKTRYAFLIKTRARMR